MKRIKRFGIYQTAKVVALIYMLIIGVFMIPIGLISMLAGTNLPSDVPFIGGGLFFILVPFFYGVVIFIMTAIGCAIYNAIAGRIGGIEIEVDDLEDEFEGETILN